MPDIVDVSKAQHRQVDQLLDEAAQDGADTAALLQKVAALLIPHSKAEEDFVYPTIRQKAADAGDEVEDGVAEHHQIEEMLQNLLRGDADDPGYDGTLAAITGELRHHVQEEEEDLLPLLEQHGTAAEREEMGRRFVEATTGSASGGTAVPSTSDRTRDDLYEEAKRKDISGRSTMSKEELAEALDEASGS